MSYGMTCSVFHSSIAGNFIAVEGNLIYVIASFTQSYGKAQCFFRTTHLSYIIVSLSPCSSTKSPCIMVFITITISYPLHSINYIKNIA